MKLLFWHIHKWTGWQPWSKKPGWEHRSCVECDYYERRRCASVPVLKESTFALSRAAMVQNMAAKVDSEIMNTPMDKALSSPVCKYHEFLKCVVEDKNCDTCQNSPGVQVHGMETPNA